MSRMIIYDVSMRSNLDIDLLHTFVTVVDTGSFTRTGEELGRT